MPAFPDFADRVRSIGGSVFERFGPKIRAKGADLMKLHIGDTYMQPAFDIPISAEFRERYPWFHLYCNTFGVAPLREALVDKVRAENFAVGGVDNIMISNGATNALSAVTMALVNPGDEVLVLTPSWPFFFGMVKLAGGTVREVPVYMELFENPELDIAALLEPHLAPRTVALHINTPNNPSGKVLERRHLEQLAAFARRHNLWLISDEAYDGLTFDERPHLSIAALPGMAERTISVFTFSKVFMLAGMRLGFLCGNRELVKAANKCMVHQLYGAQTPAQLMLLQALADRHTWIPQVRQEYQRLRDMCRTELRVQFATPEGGYFAFFPLDDYLQGRDYWQLIGECLDAGVAIAPGESFGAAFGSWIRICFTGEPPERLGRGLERLNAVLGV